MQSTPFFDNATPNPRFTVHTQARQATSNLVVENLSVKYRTIEALSQVSFSVQPA